MANNKKFRVKNGLVSPNAEFSGEVTANEFIGDGTSVTNVNALTVGGNTAGDLQTYALTVANTAYSNAVSYTDTEIANLVDTAPELLDTLNELSAAINDDPDFAISVTNQITNAYSNAVSHADSVSADAFSNAVAYVDEQTTDTIEEGSTNLYYLDSRVDSHLSGANGISYSLGSITADQNISSGANVTFTKVTGLATPTDNTDAANKLYVDNEVDDKISKDEGLEAIGSIVFAGLGSQAGNVSGVGNTIVVTSANVLVFASASGIGFPSQSIGAGTWRARGRLLGSGNSTNTVTVFERIA